MDRRPTDRAGRKIYDNLRRLQRLEAINIGIQARLQGAEVDLRRTAINIRKQIDEAVRERTILQKAAQKRITELAQIRTTRAVARQQQSGLVNLTQFWDRYSKNELLDEELRGRFDGEQFIIIPINDYKKLMEEKIAAWKSIKNPTLYAINVPWYRLIEEVAPEWGQNKDGEWGFWGGKAAPVYHDQASVMGNQQYATYIMYTMLAADHYRGIVYPDGMSLNPIKTTNTLGKQIMLAMEKFEGGPTIVAIPNKGQDFLDIERLGENLDYSVFTQDNKIHKRISDICSIDALLQSGYTEHMLIHYFGNITTPQSLSSIREFIKSKKGSYIFMDLVGQCIDRYVSKGGRNKKTVICYCYSNHVEIVLEEDARKSIIERSKATGKKTGIALKIKSKKENKTIISCPNLWNRFINHVTDTNFVPSHKYTLNKLTRYTVGDNLYTANSPTDLKLVEQIKGFKVDKSLASASVELFNDYINKEEFIIDSFETPFIKKLLNQIPCGAKCYSYKVVDGDLQQIDLNKAYSCRLATARNLHLTPSSSINKYNPNNIQPGLYIIYSEDTYLFRGDGIYTDEVVVLAIKDKIKFTCRHYIDCVYTHRGFAKQFVEDVYKNHPEAAKSICNFTIGCFNNKDKSLTLNLVLAGNNMAVDAHYYYNHYKDVLVSADVNRPDLLFVRIPYRDQRSISRRPMFIEIISGSYIESYNKMKEIKLENIYYIKTDAIGYNPVDYTHQPSAERGLYKFEPPTTTPPIYESHSFDSMVDEKPTKSDYIDMDNDHPNDQIIKNNTDLLYNDGKLRSFELQGASGTGKTSFMKELTRGKNVCIVSPTNIASLVIGGKTFHSYFNSCFDNLSRAQTDLLKTLDAIVVDEKSMMGKEHWLILCLIKSKCDTPIIIIGDWEQLPPVKDDSNYEDSQMLPWLVDSTHYKFNTIHRYDFDYNEYIENIPKQTLSAHIKKFISMEEPRAICMLNEVRRSLNRLALQKRERLFYEGQPLVAKINNHSKKYHNNEPFTVLSVSHERLVPLSSIYKDEDNEGTCLNDDDNSLDSSSDGETPYQQFKSSPIKLILRSTLTAEHVILPMYQVLKYFRFGYAITTHQSQGQSLDFKYTPFVYNMGSRQRYVAITRTTKQANLML